MMVNRSAARKCVAALIAALCLAVPVFAKKSTVVSLSRIHIDNFGRINDVYYRGAQPDKQGISDLAALGVKTVIDLTTEKPEEQYLVQRAGMKFYRIPLTTAAPPSNGAIQLFLKIVTDPAAQPVFVHCQGGRHRTGVMTAVYRMTQDHWNAAQAVAEMSAFRFDRFPTHPKLKSFVFDYYARMPRPQIAEREPGSVSGASK